MANIKLKNIQELSDWNTKELRKLRMTLNNRINSFDMDLKAKELPKNHPLFGYGIDECKVLLTKVLRQEKVN